MFSKRIKILRKKKGWSQEQLGRKLNITQGAISQWENGITMPSAEQLLSLSLLFNCSISNLLGKTDDCIDDDMLDIVNELPDELLEKHGNVLDAQREYEAQKKEAVPLDGLDAEFKEKISRLNPKNRERMAAYLDGLLDSQDTQSP